MACPNSSVVDQVGEKYGASGRYPHAEEDVLNIWIRCSDSVTIISFCIVLTPYYTFEFSYLYIFYIFNYVRVIRHMTL